MWVSGVSPAPLTDGNRQRHFHLLRETARDRDVVLVCPATGEEREALGEVSDLGVDVRAVPAVRAPRGRVFAGITRQPACAVPPDIDAVVAAVAGAGHFDLAFGGLSVARAVAHARANL